MAWNNEKVLILLKEVAVARPFQYRSGTRERGKVWAEVAERLQDLHNLKHKDSFGKSENLSKIFFAEILVFDHDYEGKSSSSNGLL